MPQLSPIEILVVATIALIVFGPEKLPQIARTIGRSAAELRRMATEVKEEFQAGLDLDDDEPPKPSRRPHPNEVATRARVADSTHEGNAAPPPTEETPPLSRGIVAAETDDAPPVSRGLEAGGAEDALSVTEDDAPEPAPEDGAGENNLSGS